ncbi:hypothetical protein EDD28_1431 [Salana multivorans]|uniref:Uncharacterized protein n=1 Tax=Salana multivorans TaxID=120377 RepID=A0A3N2DAL9_9MICO|nr:hypothetical protein [Salana multivorans]ROR96840.1 hypothetical protein EDD28_1431 [Salana multivorans]
MTGPLPASGPSGSTEPGEPTDRSPGGPAWPRLTRTAAGGHHLLLLDDDVTWSDLDALVGSSVVGATWRPAPTDGPPGLPGVLDLLAAEHAEILAAGHAVPTLPDGTLERATLTGPWRVDIVNRADLGLPPWASTAFVVDVGAERSGAVPRLPDGYGDLLDAFGDHHPTGLERQVLDVLAACARRLAGGLRTSEGVVVEPDPASAVDITLYSPTWLEPAATAAILEPHLPGLVLLRGVEEAAAAGLDGYGADWPVPTATPSSVTLHVEAAEVIPAALADCAWTGGGVIAYRLQWLADPAVRAAAAGRLPGETAAALETREHARAAISEAARALHAAAGGELVDEDELLLDPTDLA